MFTRQEIADKSIPVAQKYGIKRLSLFGSYARNEQNEQSDLDFLIDEGKMHGLIQYMGFVLDLEDTFQCHVDVIMDGIEDKDFLKRIKEDEVILYEAI